MQNVIERVLNTLIYLLESERPVTADDIRRTVPGYSDHSDEAFHRMFERDKDVLRRLGIPLELVALDAWEVDFGYTVDPEKYAIDDPGLTTEERAALSLAARMVRVGGSHAGLDGLNKLGGVERGVGLEPFGADLGSEAEVLGQLFEAVSGRCRIEMKYRTASRTVEPYGVAYRRGHWYLVGAVAGEERMYRVDRISSLKLGDCGVFVRPRGFDIKAAFRSHPWESGRDEEIVAEVVFDSDVAWWASKTLGVSYTEGALQTEIPVSNRDAFIGWILSFGPSAEVVAPEDIRQEIRSRVESALEHAGL